LLHAILVEWTTPVIDSSLLYKKIHGRVLANDEVTTPREKTLVPKNTEREIPQSFIPWGADIGGVVTPRKQGGEAEFASLGRAASSSQVPKGDNKFKVKDALRSIGGRK